MKILRGRVNIILDGQLGSTGKGLLASYISVNNHIDIAVSNCAANAGHTFYYHNKKYVVTHIPVSGIIDDNSLIYFAPGAVIDVDKLLFEMDTYDIPRKRVVIHPRCALVSKDDIANETAKESPVSKIASTRSGVGEALVRKIRRTSLLAYEDHRIYDMIATINLHEKCDKGNTVLVETSQGMDLSINSGLAYPYCTSREITVSSTLSDVQVHPSYLGKVCVSIRTYPIRVGNIYDGGEMAGYSGPFPTDTEEITWEDIGVEPEYTTVTKRERRVATFSFKQYKKMLDMLRPDYIMLNFVNYMKSNDFHNLLMSLPEVTHIATGPYIYNVTDVSERLGL